MAKWIGLHFFLWFLESCHKVNNQISTLQVSSTLVTFLTFIVSLVTLVFLPYFSCFCCLTFSMWLLSLHFQLLSLHYLLPLLKLPSFLNVLTFHVIFPYFPHNFLFKFHYFPYISNYLPYIIYFPYFSCPLSLISLLSIFFITNWNFLK